MSHNIIPIPLTLTLSLKSEGNDVDNTDVDPGTCCIKSGSVTKKGYIIIQLTPLNHVKKNRLLKAQPCKAKGKVTKKTLYV